MKQLTTIFLGAILLVSGLTVFAAEPGQDMVTMTKQAVHTTKRGTKVVVRKTRRGGKVVYHRSKRGGKWTYHKVKRGGKWTWVKTRNFVVGKPRRRA